MAIKETSLDALLSMEIHLADGTVVKPESFSLEDDPGQDALTSEAAGDFGVAEVECDLTGELAVNEDSPSAAILRRVFQPTKPFNSKTTAKEILAFELDAEDQEAMRGLAEKARAGRLTPDDERAIELYTRVAALLSIVKLKARLTLAKKPARRKAAKSA